MVTATTPQGTAVTRAAAMAAIVVIAPGMEQRVYALRERLVTVREAIDEWTHGQVVIGERYGWSHSCIAEYQGKIDAALEIRQRLLDQVAACMIELPRVA